MSEDQDATSSGGDDNARLKMCRKCTHKVGYVGRGEQLCLVHWIKSKILGVIGFD